MDVVVTKVVDNIVRDYTFRSTDPGGVVAGIGLTATSSELLLPFSDSNSFSLQTKAAALFDQVEPGDVWNRPSPTHHGERPDGGRTGPILDHKSSKKFFTHGSSSAFSETKGPKKRL